MAKASKPTPLVIERPARVEAADKRVSRSLSFLHTRRGLEVVAREELYYRASGMSRTHVIPVEIDLAEILAVAHVVDQVRATALGTDPLVALALAARAAMPLLAAAGDVATPEAATTIRNVIAQQIAALALIERANQGA